MSKNSLKIQNYYNLWINKHLCNIYILMKYFVVNLWVSSFKKISELFDPFKKGFTVDFLMNCTLKMIDYVDSFCRHETPVIRGQRCHTGSSIDYTISVDKRLSYMRFTADGQRYMIVFYHLPTHVLNFSVDYHRWQWNPKTNEEPGLILMPNLKNDPQYYLALNFEKFTVINKRQIKYHLIDSEKTLYLHPDVTFKFYLDVHLPITIYDTQGQVILGENLVDHSYLESSKSLEITQTYYISCNDMISKKTQPIIRVLIGVYVKDQLLYSDSLVMHIAPAILTPNCFKAEVVYLADVPGVQNNQSFVDEVQHILENAGYKSIIIKNSTISMYHRWMQDILKFTYCTDGKKLQYIILKGPHFAAHTRKGGDISYIYDYFKEYSLYDFFYETDRNLDAFGNVQVMPPIKPEYPFGRIIYGTSSEPSQPNISYNLVDFLEAQQIQKPIHVNTGWLSVGHVDEILSYVPDPQHRYGFRILIASTKKFWQLVSQLDPELVIFDNKDNYYVFNNASKNVKQRFYNKYQEPDQYHCVYQSQLKIKDLLSWEEMKTANLQYQNYLDENREILMKELNLDYDDFYEVPIYYWPPSISLRARSIMPNMINNLFLGKIMLVPKPYGPNPAGTGVDLFEEYFLSLIPLGTTVHFIKNWDSYYLLEGDINCGTNTKRLPFKEKWWSVMPCGAYNI
jgi:hypothetical protein